MNFKKIKLLVVSSIISITTIFPMSGNVLAGKAEPKNQATSSKKNGQLKKPKKSKQSKPNNTIKQDKINNYIDQLKKPAKLKKFESCDNPEKQKILNIIRYCAQQANCDKDCLKFLNVLNKYVKFKNEMISQETFEKSYDFINKIEFFDDDSYDIWVYTDIMDDVCDDLKKLDKNMDTDFIYNFLWFLGKEMFDFIDHE